MHNDDDDDDDDGDNDDGYAKVCDFLRKNDNKKKSLRES